MTDGFGLSTNLEISRGGATIAAPQGEYVDVMNGDAEEIEALENMILSLAKQDIAKLLKNEQIENMAAMLSGTNQEEPMLGNGIRIGQPKPTRK